MSLGLFTQEERKFNRLSLDFIKKNDLQLIFQILMVEPEGRTIADINKLVQIMLHIEPIKASHNLSAVYHACKCMYLAKYKEKTFIYQKKEEAECLYLILNGKIGLYKRSNQDQETDEVVFFSEGNCFGQIYNWKTKFLPLTFEETLVALMPRREINKITVTINIEKQFMMKAIRKAGIFEGGKSDLLYKQASNNLSLNRLPYGTYLIKKGEMPKCIFYLLKGTVKKIVEIESQFQSSNGKKLQVQSYGSGDYFPRSNLNVCLEYDLITQCPCQIITIGKKALKTMGYQCLQSHDKQASNKRLYKQRIIEEQKWKQYKDDVMITVLKEIQLKKKYTHKY